jgi:hypothetical protein
MKSLFFGSGVSSSKGLGLTVVYYESTIMCFRQPWMGYEVQHAAPMIIISYLVMYSQKEKQPKKDTKKPKLDPEKLPPSLKERYEAMGLLPQKPINKKPVVVNLDKIKQRKIEKEKSIEEKLEEIEITSTEKKALERYYRIEL